MKVMPEMTNEERVLAVYRHEPPDRIVWQPIFDHWYMVNKNLGTLPERYRGMDMLDVYDDLGCAHRRYFYGAIGYADGPETVVKTEYAGDATISTWSTPAGTVRDVRRHTEESSMLVEFPVKSIKDLSVMEYILRNRSVTWDQAAFDSMYEELGHRGAPLFDMERTPLQRLFIHFMGFENTIYALRDYPSEMERFMEVIEHTDDRAYEIAQKCPIPIVGFGDNIHSDMASPPLFRKFVLPYYKRRTASLRQGGKFTYSHVDGSFKPLIPLLKEADLDSYEALTPVPQGDATLEEMKEVLGNDRILVDGIPAVFFLPQTSYKDLETFTRRMLDLFSPNLILGISDELPPPGDIEKVRLVSDIVKDYVPRQAMR